MRTLNFLILIFFIIIAIKISIQLELILIRLKRFHLSQNKKDDAGIDQLKKIHETLSSSETKEESLPGDSLDT